MKSYPVYFLFLALSLTPPGTRAAPPDSEAAQALVASWRQARMAPVDSLLRDLESWAGGAVQSAELLDRLQLISPGLADTSDLGDVLVTAAVIHDLAGGDRLQTWEGHPGLLAATSALTQEALYRFHTEVHGLTVSLDSLRVLGDPERLPPPEGIPTVTAPTPSPYSPVRARVFLERGRRMRLTPEGELADWYAWVPGRDQFYARMGGRLYLISPGNGEARDLGLSSPPDSPAPSMSASGEYLAAVDDAARMHILRVGREEDGWAPGPGPVTAMAFSPTRFTIAWAARTDRIYVLDPATGTSRELAAANARVTGLHWSPRGESVAWDEAPSPGAVTHWAGIVAVVPGGPEPPPPSAGQLKLTGPPQWAPDGESVLGVGELRGRQGLWHWSQDHLELLQELEPASGTGQVASPDFKAVAMFLGPLDHPLPWGTDSAVPFTFLSRRLWWLDVVWPEERNGRRLFLDRPTHRDRDLTWSPDGEWLAGNLEERVELLLGDETPLARRGLWAVHGSTGEAFPVTFRAGSFVSPRLNWKKTWLLYLEVDTEGEHPDRGRLWAREMVSAKGSRRESQRTYLRALPLIRQGEGRQATVLLRDAVRLDPDAEDVRFRLASLYRDLAATAESSAEAGLLLGSAVEELVRLLAVSPGDGTYRRELGLAYLGYAAAAGRIYSAEAAARARTFLESDPRAETDLERVNSVLHAALVDAVLWDPAHRAAWTLAENGLRHYADRTD